MAFRDDLDAAHARVKALEAELARVDAENRRLRGDAAAPPGEGSSDASADAGADAVGRPSSPAWLRTTVMILIMLAAVGLGFMLEFGAPLLLTVTVVLAPVLLAAMLVLLGQLIVVAQPGHLVVLTGRSRRLPDGGTVGYRLLRQGRALRMPLIEAEQRLDIRPLRADFVLHNVYSSDHTLVMLRVEAEVVFARRELELVNAVERLLGVSRTDVTRLVRDTLERAVREVVSKSPASALTREAHRVAEAVVAVAAEPLHAYGLEPASVLVTRNDDGVDAGAGTVA